MNFSDLLWGLGVSHSGGDPEVSGLDYNSRRVQPGWVFVAMRGDSSDGNRYIDTALKHGAVAVVTDSRSEHRRPAGALGRSPARPARAGAHERQFLRPSGGKAEGHRHYRDQRQDHHQLSVRSHPAPLRQAVGADRDHRISRSGKNGAARRPRLTEPCRRRTPRRKRWS